MIKLFYKVFHRCNYCSRLFCFIRYYVYAGEDVHLLNVCRKCRKLVDLDMMG